MAVTNTNAKGSDIRKVKTTKDGDSTRCTTPTPTPKEEESKTLDPPLEVKEKTPTAIFKEI